MGLSVIGAGLGRWEQTARSWKEVEKDGLKTWQSLSESEKAPYLAEASMKRAKNSVEANEEFSKLPGVTLAEKPEEPEKSSSEEFNMGWLYPYMADAKIIVECVRELNRYPDEEPSTGFWGGDCL